MPISRGAKVAYNYQGEVRLGYVKEVKPAPRNGLKVNRWTGKPFVSIHIDNIPTDAKQRLIVSKVSKPENLVVIEKGLDF